MIKIVDVEEHYRKNISSNRATGQSFRKILFCLNNASAGFEVYYIVPKEQLRNYVADKINTILVGYFNQNAQPSGKKFNYSFPNGGSINIITKSYYEKMFPRKKNNVGNCKIVWDWI